MINIYDFKDNIICSVNDIYELRRVLPGLRKIQTVYVDTPFGFYEYPKIEED